MNIFLEKISRFGKLTVLCCGLVLGPEIFASEAMVDMDFDRDNDGIPNVVEIKVGLNPDDPDDALYDMDGDGFPNVFEYREDTDIKNAASSPPLFKRLKLLEFRETLLPYKLKTVVTNNSKDPEKWDIQVNWIQDNGRIKTKFEYLGSTIRMDKVGYRIVKIEPDYKEERHDGTVVKVDKSKVMLESFDKKYKITMQVDQDAYSPRLKAVIEDLGNGKKYLVGAGDYIVMQVKYEHKGRSRVRTAKYKVSRVERKEKRVIIEFYGKRQGKAIEQSVTMLAFMPRVKRKTKAKDKFSKNPGSPGMLEVPPGGSGG